MQTKIAVLEEVLDGFGSVAVAYSGGADSAFLADVAHDVLRDRAVAVTAVSESLAPYELDEARALAKERGWRHLEIRTHELSRPEYRRNDGNRCFQCKDELFMVLEPLADRLAVSVVAVGTNVDDLGDYRPGQTAAAQHGVRAPLVDAGLTKTEIRAASRARGLRTWDKPASACLSSRIAYGVEVTPARLARVAGAEQFLRERNFRVLRVRDHGELARIEVGLDELPRLLESPLREDVTRFLRGLGFAHVAIDLEGFRSGSMNVALGLPIRKVSS
ncbi:MAG: ATP-dependent sacrificial sulfur transferase LarE [Actinomycetota bacterium]